MCLKVPEMFGEVRSLRDLNACCQLARVSHVNFLPDTASWVSHST